MPAFAGVRGTGDWGADERPKNFREMILWMNPKGTAPIFALSSRMGKKTVDDPEFAWWAEPNDLVRLRVNGALDNAAGSTGVAVDSVDPNADDLQTHYGTALNLTPGDLLMVEPAADAAEFTPEILKVTAVAGANNFTVARGAAGSARAAIPDNSFLLKIGSAFAEGTRAPEATSRNPVKYLNYCQIFKNVYELTNTAKMTRARTGDAMANDKKRKSFDHSRDIEMAILFGRRHEIAASTANGKPERYMGGLRNFIPNAVMPNNYGMNDLLDMVSPVFDWDTPAGDERMVFCGNAALNNFNKKIEAQGDKNIRITYEGTDEMYGVKFRKYQVPQGTLYLKTHPLLSRHPIYGRSWTILDGSAVKWTCLRGRDTKFKDNIQHNDEDTTKGQWLTEGSIMVDMGGLTCRYIGNI